MKAHMNGHVDTERLRMFTAATDQAKDSLDTMLENLQQTVQEQVGHILEVAYEDFTTLLEDRNIFKAIGDVGKKIEKLLVAADARFSTVFEVQDASFVKSKDLGENVPEKMEDMSINDEGATALPVNGDGLFHQAGVA